MALGGGLPRCLQAACSAVDALLASGRPVGDGEAAAVLRTCDTYEQAAALLRRLRTKRVQIGTQAYSAVLAVCARQGAAERAEEVLAEMAERGVPQEPEGGSQLALLRAYAAARDANGCYAHLQRLLAGKGPSVPPSLAEAYQIQLAACEAQCHPRGDAPGAVEIAGETLEHAINDGCATPQLWARVVSVCGAARDLDGMEHVRDRMEEEGVRQTELCAAAFASAAAAAAVEETGDEAGEEEEGEESESEGERGSQGSAEGEEAEEGAD
eukprot:TRINITY_DN6400_c0_g1_i1.p2 TRINITY_DN6400_c0_g1~~TRINITY_DN6400_c0_g1_i1.p2  ORF type:complete len:269 (+),score=92.19 TRINITY_DN6400_c0_g1_i1:109-915(+)